jgi:hypothetical protein
MAALFGDKSVPAPPKLSKPVAAPHPAAAPAPKTVVVQVYNGSKRSDEKFVDGEEKP